MKLNAHVHTRRDPQFEPYVESCKRAGIFPVRPICCQIAHNRPRSQELNRTENVPREYRERFSKNKKIQKNLAGGGGGIRTHETLSGLTVFKTAGVNRFPTPPFFRC